MFTTNSISNNRRSTNTKSIISNIKRINDDSTRLETRWIDGHIATTPITALINTAHDTTNTVGTMADTVGTTTGTIGATDSSIMAFAVITTADMTAQRHALGMELRR